MIEIGHIKLNILFALSVLGVVGYLIEINYLIMEFVTPEGGTIGEITRLMLNTFAGIICLSGSMVYILRWWIFIAVLILWTTTSMSKRENENLSQ